LFFNENRDLRTKDLIFCYRPFRAKKTSTFLIGRCPILFAQALPGQNSLKGFDQIALGNAQRMIFWDKKP